jgi:hypothetical protein
VFANERIYGEAQESGDEGVFFERQYSPATLEERLLLRLPWQVETEEFARQKDESVEERFYARAPWSYLYGGLLRRRCARNFEVEQTPELLRERGHGTVYLELRKR